MDPLSVTASIIAVLGAGGTIVGTLEKANLIRKAPETILSLNNEISDLRLIVHETQRLLRENQDRDPAGSDTRTFADDVTPILIRGRDKLLELESLIEYSLTAPKTSTSSKPRIRKAAWILKQQKVQSIKDEIRSLRINLAAIVGIVASRTTSRLELRISQIQTDNNALQTRLDNALPDILGHQTRSADLLDNLFRSFTTSHRTPDADSSTLLTPVQSGPIAQRTIVPGLQIHVVRSFDSCSQDCSCACHSRSIWRSPQYLQFFLGLLFTGYTGLPILNPRCNAAECIQSSQSSIHLKYFFPSWLLACVIEYYIRISRSYGVSQCLRVSNIVDYSASIMLLAQLGDTEGLKKLLSSRKASPFDVDPDGTTALDAAIDTGHIETIQLLLDAGSDPHVESRYRRIPYTYAWGIIMSTRNTPLADALRSMFPNPDLESYGFTPIHKVVLKLCPLSLIQVIGLCTREVINQPDKTGVTPLMWAAYCGDLQTVELLLLNGADPDKATLRGTALCYAAQAGSYSCVDSLLCRGADPNLRDQYAQGPLEGLVFSRTDDVTTLILLNATKINLNQINNFGGTPLTFAIQRQQHQIAMKLIYLGADIHPREHDGTNGLYMATYFNSHSIIKLLLDRGGDHVGAVQDTFGSYLHLIAHAADLRTLNLLTSALVPRDICYRRPDGMTALDVARNRSDVDSNWRDAFNTFIGSVYKSTMVSVVEEVSTVDDEFTDALEQQP